MSPENDRHSPARAATPRPLLVHLTCAVVPLLALCWPAAAQHQLFYGDFRELGRIDSPPAVGELEATVSTMTTSPIASLARLPDGTILRVGDRLESVDPETLELTDIMDLAVFCRDVTADGEGNLWCIDQSTLYCLAAQSYEPALTVEHPGFVFRAIATLGARIYAVAHLADDYLAGPHLLEIEPSTGGASLLAPLPLPPSPIEGRFFEVFGMDFDANGDLWLGLPLYYPSIVLPPAPDGYVTRVLDPLGGAVVRPPQAVLGTNQPTPLVLGAPTITAVPAVGPAGLSVLAALLIACALTIIARRP